MRKGGEYPEIGLVVRATVVWPSLGLNSEHKWINASLRIRNSFKELNWGESQAKNSCPNPFFTLLSPPTSSSFSNQLFSWDRQSLKLHAVWNSSMSNSSLSCQMLRARDTRYKIQYTRYKIQDTRYNLQDASYVLRSSAKSIIIRGSNMLIELLSYQCTPTEAPPDLVSRHCPRNEAEHVRVSFSGQRIEFHKFSKRWQLA